MKTKTSATVFVIEDDNTFLEMICDFIKSKFPELTVYKFTNGEDALKQMNLKPKIIILDYYLDLQRKDAQNGLDVLVDIIKVDPSIRVIMVSAQENLDVAVNIMRYGAYDYIVKSETALYRLENLLNHLTGHLILDKKVIANKLLLVLVVALLIVIMMIISFRH